MNRNYSIYLRGFKESDYELINKWRHNRDIQALLCTPFKYVPEAIEREWVKSKSLNNRTDIYLAICLKSDDTMVGYASIINIDYQQRKCECGGLIIAPEHQDGIIRYETSVIMRELIFDQMNMNRYETVCLAEHIPSRILMEATGYQLEGVKRQAVYKDGRYHDECMYSLLREDYYAWMERGDYALSSFSKKVRALKKKYSESEI